MEASYHRHGISDKGAAHIRDLSGGAERASGRNRPPDRGFSEETLLADRGYDTNDIVSYAVSAEMVDVIPPKKSHKEQCQYDKYFYKLRHLAENCFLALKRWRGIAVRYAKTSDAFIAAAPIHCIAVWAAIRTLTQVDNI